ncbi:MAG: efflux RND transporter periplasmic adaptor subunit [Phycisphaeraceae bacterium]|nr:efflux RND transporter periplasmic adaptor subunit [Phycisphaeraceae bacterium]
MRRTVFGTTATTLRVLAPAMLAGVLLLGGCGRGDPAGQAGGEAGGPGAGAPQGPPPALVRLAVVKQEELASRWDVVGRLVELQRSAVAAEQSGRIVEMHVDIGDKVNGTIDTGGAPTTVSASTDSSGGATVLARIDPTWATLRHQEAVARVKQSEANLAAAEADLATSTRNLGFLRDLHDTASVRPKEFQDAQDQQAAGMARVQSARADLESTRAELERAEVDLRRLNVLAPFDGVVVKKMAEVGQWVSEGTPVVEIISRGQIDALVNVPESLVNRVPVGRELELVIEPLKTVRTGTVVAVVPDADNAARTFPVKVRLSDEDGLLKPGMSVTGRVPTSVKQMVLTVPRDAVSQSATGPVVWASLNGQAMPVGVLVLFVEGDRVAIRAATADSPLHPGLEVVIEGAERLFPTRPLMTPEQMAAAAAQQGGAGQDRPAKQQE